MNFACMAVLRLFKTNKIQIVMKKTLGILALMCTFFLAQGQGIDFVGKSTIFVGGMVETAGLDPSCLDASGGDSRNITNDIDGYPFLVKGWGKGLITIDGQELACNKINVFFYTQQMWVMLEDEIMTLEPRENIEAVVIEGKRMVGRMLPAGNGDPCWVEELEAGPLASVYKHYTSKYTGSILSRTGMDPDTKANFINKSVLYASFDGGALQELPEKNAAFLALFSKNADKMKQYLSANKINLKKEGDVLRAMSYYNTL